MKMAMYLAGIFKSPAVQPPTRPPSAAETEAIKAALRDAGMLRTGISDQESVIRRAS
jgi:dihydrodipicolinate synthase/N-acetylneuraminate lyase